ncbi:MAG TPA: fibrobacter succinogenes major paralogous domain-containing protein [Saprospiraceae bacterium]|nr:fibrobacter succinogenes major paralogous domain-containing protein [Saprospiraceae bacterium]
MVKPSEIENMFATNVYFMSIHNLIRRVKRTGLILMAGLLIIMQSCGDDGNATPVKQTGLVTDREGNTYKTIRIGNQWWMAEDLRVTTFASGELIPLITSPEEWASATYPALTHYNNSTMRTEVLYNHHVIGSGEYIAPPGWRVPTDEDWKILEEYLGLPVAEIDETNWRGTDQGDQLKIETTTTEGWIRYDGVWGTNSSGFSATGGSCRVFNGEWGIPPTRHSGYWWTSTVVNGHAWYRYLDYKKSGIFRYTAHPNYGFSIRCVKE